MDHSDETKAPARILPRVVAKELSLDEMERVVGGTFVTTGTNHVRPADDIDPDN